jgi:hypothetical protein
MIRLILYVFFFYNMSDKIKRMSMNVAFWLWQKERSCLTYGRIVHLYIMYQTFYGWLSSSKDKIFNILAIWLRLWDQENDAMNILKEQVMLSYLGWVKQSYNSIMFVSSFLCIPKSRGNWWPFSLRCYLHLWSMITWCDEG